MTNIELMVTGVIIGIVLCMLFSSVTNWWEITQRNRRHQELLDAGMDPLDILRLGL